MCQQISPPSLPLPPNCTADEPLGLASGKFEHLLRDCEECVNKSLLPRTSAPPNATATADEPLGLLRLLRLRRMGQQIIKEKEKEKKKKRKKKRNTWGISSMVLSMDYIRERRIPDNGSSWSIYTLQ
jgi:hypothetical protein